MGLFDHFRKKKTGPAEEQTAGVLKPEQEDGKQNVEASEPEQKQEAEVTRPVEKQTAAVPESTSEQMQMVFSILGYTMLTHGGMV